MLVVCDSKKCHSRTCFHKFPHIYEINDCSLCCVIEDVRYNCVAIMDEEQIIELDRIFDI